MENSNNNIICGRNPVLEALRQPMEDGEVTVSRINARCTYPANFQLVCAMNPCRCGYYGSGIRECTCRREDIKKYLSKISGPLLDRIDIQVELPALSFDELTREEKSESSAQIRARVEDARSLAVRRMGSASACNAAMTRSEIREFCAVGDASLRLLKTAFEKMNLSARGYDRVLRVARTVADLAHSESIEPQHVAEAIQLRSLDKKYFGI